MWEFAWKTAGIFDVCVGVALFMLAASFAFAATERRWPANRWQKYGYALFAGAMVGIGGGVMRSLIHWIWNL